MTKYTEENYNTLYENQYFLGFVEDTLRPGGVELTARNFEKANLPKGAKVLDLGCGCGKTVKFLRDQMGFESFGIDKSKGMIMNGLLLDNSMDIQVAEADNLPFSDNSFDAVVTECVFCLLPDKEKALKEIKRVLKKDGFFIVSDMYLRSPSMEPVSLNAITCLQSLMTEAEIRDLITSAGFENQNWDCCHEEYLSFLGQLIFSFDTVQGFWQCLLGKCEDLQDDKQRMKRKKISYYSAIWQVKKD